MSKGMRGTYLAPAMSPNLPPQQVSAGTAAPGTGPGGGGKTVNASAPAGFKGGAKPTLFVDKKMREGKGKGARKGMRGTFL